MKNLNEDVQVHDTLNPKIWDTETNKLKPEVRSKVLEIVEAFKDNIYVDIDIVDVQLVGSNASFNYTENSDLDVEIVANFETLSEDSSLVNTVYGLFKTQFNKDYDISLHGVEVELYVVDIKGSVESNGIYSVIDDDWIKFPKRLEVPSYDLTAQMDAWRNEIMECMYSGSAEEIQDFIDTLYLMRKNAIAVDGEFSEGNQLFKEIRNSGLLQELKDKKKELQTQDLTLEHLNR